LRVAQWVWDQLQLPQQEPQQEPSEQPQSDDQGDGDGDRTPGDQAAQSDDQGEGEGTPGDQTTQSGSGDPDQSKVPGGDEDCLDVEPSIEPSAEGGKQRHYDKRHIVEPVCHMGKKQFPITPITSGKLRYEVRKLFENSGFDDWAINKKSGALNVNALHSVNTNVRVFKRHNEVEGIESAVVILVDVSSSMTLRMGVTRDAAAALYQTLSAAGVAVAVVAFDNHVSLPVPFGTPVKRAVELISRLDDNGSTNDYLAIRYAHELLLGRRENRKVVLSLTDGEGLPMAARLQCEIGERLGITTIGIGIQEDVSRVYPRAIKIDNLEDLATVSFKQIKLAA